MLLVVTLNVVGITPKRLPRQFNRTASKKVKQYIKKRNNKRPRQNLRYKRSARKLQKVTAFVRKYGLKIGLLFLFLVGVISFLVLIFSSLVTVRSIAFDDSTLRIDRETVQQALKPLFGKHLFMVSRLDVLPLLQEVYPDVTNVSLHKVYPDTLSLTFELYPLVAQLTIADDQAEPLDDQAPETGSGLVNTHFITETGLYVRLAVPSQQNLDLPVYTVRDWGIKPQQNQLLVPPELLVALKELEVILQEQFGHEITNRIIFARAQEFHIEVGDRYLWFDIRSTVEEQLERYRTFLETSINFPVTEYIDLRLADRVVWK